MPLKKNNLNTGELIEKSSWLRNSLLDMVEKAGKGHIPSSFSIVEVVNSLFYGGFVSFDPEDPRNPERDRVFVSKGHGAMTLYPVLADLGFFDKKYLNEFTKKDSLLRLYADSSIPGIEATTGSLGHGFGLGCGHALSALRSGQSYKTFVIMSDGECYEGSVWEAAMFASHYELTNLVVVVDRNGQCILGETENCLKLDSLEKKWESFGWNVESVDGHSYKAIISALGKIRDSGGSKPAVIISNSTKGKGVPFMESDRLWHNKIPDKTQFSQAREELKTNRISD